VKTMKQAYAPPTKGTARIIIYLGPGRQSVFQTTTKQELSIIKAIVTHRKPVVKPEQPKEGETSNEII